MHTLTIDIDGMTCAHCTARVEKALLGIDGVDRAELSLDPGQARIQSHDPLDRQQLTEAIELAGYDVLAPHAEPSRPPEDSPAPEKNADDNDLDRSPPSRDKAPASPPTPQQGPAPLRVEIGGMTCASCVQRVENALAQTPGVERALVNFATERAEVHPAADQATDEAFTDSLRQAVEQAGYEVLDLRAPDLQDTTTAQHTSPTSESARPSLGARRRQEAQGWKQRWLTGLALTLPIVALQMGPHWAGLSLTRDLQLFRLSMLAYLTGLTLITVGKPFFVQAARAARHLNTTMDSLVALGAGIAFLYSSVVTALLFAGSTALGEQVFFDGAAMIVSLIALGKWLEARAKGRASAAIEGLLSMAPEQAWVQQGQQWVQRPVETLQPGDLVLVKPGEAIPVDGIVRQGQAAVDTSMITGESVPQKVAPGDEVTGATINSDGRLEVEVRATGAETTLAQIVDLVERAQASKADIQRLADKISSVFVPAIMITSLLTFLGWLLIAQVDLASAIQPAVAVLIVACPCALGLATPTAIMVGTGRGASLGIVIRDAQALEQVGKLDAVVFDKTGTLTRGQMSLHSIETLGALDDDQALRLAAAIEDSSTHPLARAIVEGARDRDLGQLPTPDHFESEPGDGLRAQIEGRSLQIGRIGWLEAQIEQDAQDRIDTLRAQGATVIGLADDEELLAIFAIKDELKPAAVELLAWLESQGIERWMLTGDDPITARAIADELGLPHEFLRAGLQPEDKVRALKEIQDDGRRCVAMVGDGINDAPALAQADLGIAMGSGTRVAIEAADITLMSEDLQALRRSILLARFTYAKIRQNLFWAFLYNTALVPVAALGFLIPSMAAGAMALSSVSVVSNALLLKGKRLD